MIKGNISKEIWLRKKDEGKGLTEKINKFNIILCEKLSLVEAANSNIDISVHQIKKTMKDADMDISNVEPFLNQILDNHKNVYTQINHYTFPRKNT